MGISVDVTESCGSMGLYELEAYWLFQVLGSCKDALGENPLEE